jgi:hypothetical protein
MNLIEPPTHIRGDMLDRLPLFVRQQVKNPSHSLPTQSR